MINIDLEKLDSNVTLNKVLPEYENIKANANNVGTEKNPKYEAKQLTTKQMKIVNEMKAAEDVIELIEIINENSDLDNDYNNYFIVKHLKLALKNINKKEKFEENLKIVNRWIDKFPENIKLDDDLVKIFNTNKSFCLENLDLIRNFKNKPLNEQIIYLNGRIIRPNSNSNENNHYLLILNKKKVENIEISLKNNPLITITFKEDVESYHNYPYYYPNKNNLLVNPWNIL